MNIIQKESVTVEYVESLNAVLLNWHKIPDDKELATVLFVFREFVEENNVKNWIINTSHLYANTIEEEGWVINAWHSTLISAGIENKAIIISAEKYLEMGIEEIMGKIDVYNDFEMRFFPSFIEAKKWIEKMNLI